MGFRMEKKMTGAEHIELLGETYQGISHRMTRLVGGPTISRHSGHHPYHSSAMLKLDDRQRAASLAPLYPDVHTRCQPLGRKIRAGERSQGSSTSEVGSERALLHQWGLCMEIELKQEQKDHQER
ncbi:hypothetical protein CISG_04975 [Coccidioides immitis RMSCC 3703]|uniref:Uncharacterized protein n=1 Tax=Coccidioides immitis RMSCC 3703 TaxID=454286 RepID=A0A0J8TPE0_COCIT|nr:hypothetical protein CISG_04975 [Coccidioides immitis RMSCC 3703]